MMASSRMGWWQTLQLYEQFEQTGCPSERRRRLVSAVTLSRHLAHLKQPTWKKDCPNAITTPPFSSMTVRWHPGHILFSAGETGSGSREPDVVGEWAYGIDWDRLWDGGEMAASIDAGANKKRRGGLGEQSEIVEVEVRAGDWIAKGNDGERESERTAGSDQQVEEE
jgi:hypothetical protein